jgi:hypothetical protein
MKRTGEHKDKEQVSPPLKIPVYKKDYQFMNQENHKKSHPRILARRGGKVKVKEVKSRPEPNNHR